MNARVPATAFQPDQALSQLSERWDGDILKQLTEYIAIPAKSPGFAPDWEQQGLLDRVLRNAADWVEAQKVPGLRLEILRMPGRTPVLFFEVEATRPASQQTVLMYGHLDKQPEFDGWRRTWARGPRNTRTESSTAVAARTTAMPSMPASPPCRKSSARAFRTRASWG